MIRAFERPVYQTLEPERFGRYFENAVGARFIEAGWETYYWKHRDFEVDFVVIGPENQRWAIEVKTQKATTAQLKGIFEFNRRHPDFEPCLLSLEPQDVEGVRSLDPVEMGHQARARRRWRRRSRRRRATSKQCGCHWRVTTARRGWGPSAPSAYVCGRCRSPCR